MIDRIAPTLLALLAVAGIATAAAAADTFYLGRWKIVSAVAAPWATGDSKPDKAEMRRLVGKAVAIGPKAIDGPPPLGCRGPHYKLSDFTADMLFQGSFGEMHENDKSIDPGKVAAGLGFKGTSWKTLETGCANELDFHFPDPMTAEFGLNNYVYILQKQ